MPLLLLASGTEEAKGNDDEVGSQGNPQENQEDPTYEFSLDPDTKAAEKKLRRVVGKQVGRLEFASGQTSVLLSWISRNSRVSTGGFTACVFGTVLVLFEALMEHFYGSIRSRSGLA